MNDDLPTDGKPPQQDVPAPSERSLSSGPTPPSQLESRLIRRSGVLAVLVFVIGLALTALLAEWHKRSNALLAETAFLRQSDRLAQVLRQNIQSYERGLRGLRGIFVVDPTLNRQQFAAYVASRDVPAEFPGVTGMAMVRFVPRHEVESFVQLRRAELGPGFSLSRQETSPGAAMIIDYFEPASAAERRLGFDIASQSELREAAMRAMWTGEMALSPTVDLGQIPELAFVLPIYRPGAVVDTALQRSQATLGWVLMQIESPALFSSLLDPQVAIQIFDLVTDQDPQLIFTSTSPPSTPSARPEFAEPPDEVSLQYSREIAFGQRHWHLVATPLPEFWRELALVSPALTYSVGLLGSLLAALLVYFLLTTRRRALRLAEQMTERLRFNETRQHDFSLSASDWFWETDAEHRFSYFSENYENFFLLDRNRVLGIRRQELLQKNGLIDPQVLADHVACLDAHQPFRRLEYRLPGKEGGLRWFSVSGVPFFDADGHFAGYRGVGEDATARKEAEATLREARDEAERANAAKTVFLSRMSHELRTPLNAILGFGQLLHLDRELLNATQADSVEEILAAGEHLLALVNEVLDLARIESGRVDLKMETVALAPVLAACFAQLRPLAAQHDVTLTAPEESTMRVTADATRLKQILFNLLSNAIKYNRPHGSVRVTAMTDDRYVRVEVSDTGDGIPGEHLPRLFKPFERIDLGHHVEGTGVGLALVKKLVDSMGGEVGVNSQLGRGSTFWFTLVLANGHPRTAKPAAVDGR